MAILGTLAGVMDTFKLPGGISVERRTSQIVDGYQEDATVSVLVFPTAVVHAVTGRDLLLLPEGDRTKEVIAVFTPTRLRTALEGSTEQPDVVLYTPTGEAVENSYVVKTAEDWYAQSGHFRCLAVRQPTT